MIELAIRSGGVDDESAVLALFDDAIAWLVQRGLVGQWGEQPLSARLDMTTMVREMLTDNEIRIAEHDGAVVGVLAAGPSPPYAPSNPAPELYVLLLLSARRLSGNRIGARLLELAGEMARERGALMLRVDCWADSPALVKYYERHGFVRADRFNLNGWRGQILSRQV